MRERLNTRLKKNSAAKNITLLLTVVASLIVFLMLFGLFVRSRPILAAKSFNELFFSTSWHPLRGEFGFLPFIMGTLWVTGVSLILSVPFSLLTAIYLSEYAPRFIRDAAKPLIDLLAGIPSVVYGVWGILIIVPSVGKYIAPLFGTFSSGYCILSGGIVLAIMIFPVITHVSIEVFSSIPYEIREAALALGATKWQAVKKVVLKKARPGIMAAVVLGLSRAFGETMAVLMVVGNVAAVPKSAFEAGYPLPALIANNYGEMMSVPLYDSALMLAALVLLLVVLIFNIVARFILVRLERKLE